jgi:hypothetical protein
MGDEVCPKLSSQTIDPPRRIAGRLVLAKQTKTTLTVIDSSAAMWILGNNRLEDGGDHYPKTNFA